MHGFKTAIKAWQKRLGLKHVMLDAKTLKIMKGSTFRDKSRLLAVIEPKTKQDVIHCIKISDQHKIPMYPVSKGRNWGYGSKAPTSKASVIMSLRRLNRILDFSEEHGYITVEPGVTPQIVFDYLRQKKSLWIMGAPSTAPDTSIVGNILDRGIARTPADIDRFASLIEVEAVLPNGEVFHTGLSHYTQRRPVKVAKLINQLLGPLLPGLFIQSNFAIITAMTYQLVKCPRYLSLTQVFMNKPSDFKSMLNTLGTLTKEQVVIPGVQFANDYFALCSTLVQYPWKEMKDKTPLNQNQLKNFQKKLAIAAGKAWLMADGSSLAEIKAKNKEIQQALQKYGKLQTVTYNRKQCLLITNKLRFHKHDKSPEAQQWLLSAMGLPIQYANPLLYWRKKTFPQIRLDPERDKCGCIILTATSPIEEHCFATINKIISNNFLRHGFEPIVTINFISTRVAVINAYLVFDLSKKTESKLAQDCYNKTLNKLIQQGYYPYRLPNNAMDKIPHSTLAYNKILKKIKKVFDPHHILSKGRYESK